MTNIDFATLLNIVFYKAHLIHKFRIKDIHFSINSSCLVKINYRTLSNLTDNLTQLCLYTSKIPVVTFNINDIKRKIMYKKRFCVSSIIFINIS